jgi:uncharacterized membrane protein YidH (DUF202 family)
LTGPPDDIEAADPGLAWERTELAWTRTAISFAAVGAAILKSRPYAGIPILILSGLIWELGQLARAPGPGWARPRRLLLTTVAITGVSVIALGIVLAGPDPTGLRP